MYVELCSRDGSDPEAVSGSSTNQYYIRPPFGEFFMLLLQKLQQNEQNFRTDTNRGINCKKYNNKTE